MTDTYELPPLPKPENEAASDGCTYACPEGFTADQMKEYASLAVKAERERAAKVAEDLSIPTFIHSGRYHDDGVKLKEHIAAAIRQGIPS